jgi:tetratricopeptide (TPR) repeat protein
MSTTNNSPAERERTASERLVDIADEMFDRATKLEEISLEEKDNEETNTTIGEMRDAAFNGVIHMWRVIIDMLPSSGLEQSDHKELEVDGYKVISRCYHRLNNLEAAEKSIIKAIDLGYTDGFISLGAILMDLERYTEAEEAFQSALAKDIQTTRAQSGLGELYFKLGTEALGNGDDAHVEYFQKAEEAFLAAGKDRFSEGYERAMDLFNTIGWGEKASHFGEKAVQFYGENRLKYGDRLKALDSKLRSVAGRNRYERLLDGVGKKLGNIMGGKGGDSDL